jgi:hypothetical protein
MRHEPPIAHKRLLLIGVSLIDPEADCPGDRESAYWRSSRGDGSWMSVMQNVKRCEW